MVEQGKPENFMDKVPFKNKKILTILDKYKDIWALSYVSAVANWDLETYMPLKGAEDRGEAMAKISSLGQKLFLDKEFVGLIHKSSEEKNLTDEEKGVVRTLENDLKFYTKLPAEFLEEFEKLTANATVIWREAKEKNDFKLFESSLTKIFEMNRQRAEYLGYEASPYDALLDLFEDGLTSREVEKFFGEIKNPLKNLLGKILKSDKYKDSHYLEKTGYDKTELTQLNDKILNLFWAEPDRFRIDVSTHPFTTSFSRNDTRITTWYHEVDFGRSVLATIHEFGHALYDLQSGEALEMTPIAGGGSLVVHESQSRFWENFIGRSPEFIEKFLPDMQKAVGKEISAQDVLEYFNKVSPGLLRVEADEVTYHFHIMLRFEIEKDLIEGKIKVKDLPEVWNQKMKEYLGISPQTDSDGVLQDIHWSGGAVGYFPTYSLGTFLGSQWEKQIEMEYGKLTMENLDKVRSWLGEHIHKYGSTYTLQELLKKNGMKFEPGVNLKYLEDKYSKIYGF